MTLTHNYVFRQLVGGLLLALSMPVLAGDPFVGNFTAEVDGKRYELLIEHFSGAQYDGVWQVDGKPQLLYASRRGDQFRGRVGDADEGFNFVARAQGALLLFDLPEGRRIRFTRK